jgi:anti-sigma regulatory factor (Ser/Thr protein kinase)
LLRYALPARSTAIRGARAYVRDGRSGVLRPNKVAEAELLTTELFTNALRHAHLRAGDPVGLEVIVTPRSVRVSVIDAGSGFDFGKMLREPPNDTGGWGLFLVESIADRWGIDESPPHRAWFEIDR